MCTRSLGARARYVRLRGRTVDQSVAVEREGGIPAAGMRLVPWAIALFFAMTVAGLYYVKWGPYFHKAFTAIARHSIGPSIISGTGAAPPAVGWRAAWSFTVAYFGAIWQAMVLGLLVGSAVQVLLPREWPARAFGKAGWLSTALAGGVSVPSMMCTCCAAPVAIGLRTSRASTGATVAYWLGNPTLNPATMIFLGFVLGWHWVALRVVAGVVLVFTAAYLTERVTTVATAPAAVPVAPSARQAYDARSLVRRWGRALWQLSSGLVPEYAVIVLALGAMRAWMFPAVTPAIGHSALVLPLLAVAGTVFVIPTAGEVPIVQTLMSFGLGAGGAAVLLTTLAPVSLPSLVMMGRVLPVRVLALTAALVACLGLAAAGAAQLLRF